MKVLVTGAFGNIGEFTIKALLEQGHDVVCFDQKNAANKAVARRLGNCCQVVWGDIRDAVSVRSAVVHADAVIHLAAIIPPLSESNETLAHAVNVDGTKNVIVAMENSIGCKRLIFASTTAVHGSDARRIPPINEETPLNPPDAYARHKVLCEQLLRESALDWTILRVAATPPLDIRKAQKASVKVLFEVPVDTRVEVLHSADAGLAFANAVSTPGSIGKTLFLGGGKKNGCQILGYDMVCAMTEGAGIGRFPKAAFTVDPNSVHADWVDSGESQRLLNFQRHSMRDMTSETRKQAGWLFYVTRVLSPVIRRVMLRQSPYYQINLQHSEGKQ